MTRDEFEQSLINPILFWSSKTKDEVLKLMGSDVAAMVGFDQRNPHHCYDLFSHTLHTVEALDKGSSVELRVAAFFHDIGKPQTAKEKQGRLVFYGHSVKSAEISGSILRQLGYNDNEIELICFYISHHDDFVSWVLPNMRYDHNNPHLIPITEKSIETHFRNNKQLHAVISCGLKIWLELITLCEADADSQAWYVYRSGSCTDSKAHKLQKLEMIRRIAANCINKYS